MNSKEKELLRFLLKKEIREFEAESETVIQRVPAFLAAEERYDLFMKNLLKKLE